MPNRHQKRRSRSYVVILLGLLWLLSSTQLFATQRDRARDLGIPFIGETGPLNGITDVRGVEVGHKTLISGHGPLVRGVGPIRTGVTVIHPRGKASTEGVYGGWFTLNASGEMTGTTWLQERGLIDGPIGITNTHSVGIVRDAFVGWMVDQKWPALWHAPVVAETYDGALNDINGQHVQRSHVYSALEAATAGTVIEGAVGGGTGMVCNGFKGGIGTASRVVSVAEKSFVVGVLVQCNYNWGGDSLRLGDRWVFDDLPVGEHCYTDPDIAPQNPWFPYCSGAELKKDSPTRDGSIIVVVATDAPLLPHQLHRLAKRPSLALGRLGAISNPGSGDIFVAFSTGNGGAVNEDAFNTVEQFPNNALNALFRGTVEATEEAIVNAMVAATTMTGADGLRVQELPHDKVRVLFAE
ncbi:P1 family peptidase [Draconibacterium sp.]|nr:P1 family peptidase [Luminiphilus sp.]MDB4581921.1 P1 family peptidase [Draconibacterium sp.]